MYTMAINKKRGQEFEGDCGGMYGMEVRKINYNL